MHDFGEVLKIMFYIGFSMATSIFLIGWATCALVRWLVP